MLRVLGLRKLPKNLMGYEYELQLHDEEERTPGYTFETKSGTKAQVRAILENGGMTEAQIEVCFAQAG